MIAFRPTTEEQAVLDQVRRLAAEEIRPSARTAERNGISREIVDAYLELGIALAEYPEPAGGVGLSFLTRVLIEEELAFGDPAAAAGLPGPGAAGQLLLALRPDGLRPWLEQFDGATARYGAFAIWEAGQIRSNPPMVDTRLERCGASYRLNGVKICVAQGQRAALHVVVCRYEGALAVVVLPAGAKTVSEPDELRLGLRAVPSARVVYAAVEAGEECLLAVGQSAIDGISAALARIRLITAARVLGAAHAALDYATGYALDRRTFGRPIAEHQEIAFMIADMTIATDAARLSIWRAARAIDEMDAQRDRLAALAIAQAFDTGLVATNNAVQILGGHGYVQDHPVEKWMRDVRTLIDWWGTPTHNPAAPRTEAQLA